MTSVILSASSNYEACAKSKDEAKAELAQQISTNIQTSFNSNSKVSTDMLGTNSKEEVAYTIQSSSSLTLSNVKFKSKDKEICASVTKDDLIRTAKGKIKSVKAIKLSKLPKDEIDTVNLLEGYLNDTNQAIAIASLMSDEFSSKDFDLLNEKKKALLDKRSKYNGQKISFNISPIDAVLTIDGKTQNRHYNISLKPGKHNYLITMPNYKDYKKEFTLNKNQSKTVTIDLAGNRYPQVYFAVSDNAKVKINNKTLSANSYETIEPGEHKYKVTLDGYCPDMGDLEIKLGETKTIHVDIDSLKFPTLTINSNQESAKLKIDAQPYSLGQRKVFKECQEGTVSYSVSFDGDSKTDSTTLSPGMDKVIGVDFLTKSNKEELKRQAEAFRTKDRYSISAQYAIAKNYKMPVYALDIMKHRNWLRIGGGAVLGYNNTNTIADLHVNAAFQLTEFGEDKLPLHIDAYAIIPYVGFQGAVAYNTFYADDYAFASKAVLGSNFVINKDVSIDLFAHKNFIYAEEYVIGIGLSLTDPFSK